MLFPLFPLMSHGVLYTTNYIANVYTNICSLIMKVSRKPDSTSPRVKWFGGSVRGDAKCAGGVTLKYVILYHFKLFKI